MGRDDYYIKSALLTGDSLPELKDAYTTMQREESNMGVFESSSVSETKINATFFVVESFNRKML